MTNDAYGMNAEGTNPDVYFAADTSTGLASTCIAKSQSFYTTLNANYYLDKLITNWQFYHGEYYAGSAAGDAHKVTFVGEEGELAALPVNHFRNIAEHILNMITANRPTMEARAINTDYKSLAQTYLANGILEYYMREKNLERAIRKVTEMAIVLGASFLRLEWNATAGNLYDFDPETGEKNYEGELEFSVLSPFDVVFDGTKETWNNEWIIVRTFQNRFNLAAKYPEHKDAILRIPSKSQQQQYRYVIFSNDSTDDIPVYEFFHKKSEAIPQGRYCMYLDSETILLDIPLPYAEIPIFRMAAAEFMGTPYGYSPMFDIVPLQEAINSIFSTILTNQQAFGVQNIFVENGSDLDINSLEGAMNIIMGNKPPVPLNLTQTPKEIFEFLQILIQSAETISGVNSVTRGNPEASLKSGNALALVQSMSLQFISGLQQNYVKFIEDVGTSLINILQDYATTPKMVSLVGENNKYMLKEFTSDDINKISRVIVSVGNPLAKTTAGRVQMAEQLLQMGLIENSKQYLQIINTGEIESGYESTIDELMNIKRENEFLMQGRDVMADILDSHKEHIMEHRALISDPELRADQELRQKVQSHIQEHIDMLRTVDPDLLLLTNQTPLQNPGAPQMPPPMPGPGAPPPPGPQGPPMQKGPPPPMHVVHHQAPQMGKILQQPNGMPNPSHTINGPANPGNSLPQPAHPPAPFQHLPTNPANIPPQG